MTMRSHPNFVGYDAFEGNPRCGQRSVKTPLPVATLPLKKSDFNKALQPGWLQKLEAVRRWSADNGADFSVSPYDYQLAKIRAPHSVIVLWAAKSKPQKIPFIKPTFEGPVRHHSQSEAALVAIGGLVSA